MKAGALRPNLRRGGSDRGRPRRHASQSEKKEASGKTQAHVSPQQLGSGGVRPMSILSAAIADRIPSIRVFTVARFATWSE
jgi:hypothetical protein